MFRYSITISPTDDGGFAMNISHDEDYGARRTSVHKDVRSMIEHLQLVLSGAVNSIEAIHDEGIERARRRGEPRSLECGPVMQKSPVPITLWDTLAG